MDCLRSENSLGRGDVIGWLNLLEEDWISGDIGVVLNRGIWLGVVCIVGLVVVVALVQVSCLF